MEHIKLHSDSPALSSVSLLGGARGVTRVPFTLYLALPISDGENKQTGTFHPVSSPTSHMGPTVIDSNRRDADGSRDSNTLS